MFALKNQSYCVNVQFVYGQGQVKSFEKMTAAFLNSGGHYCGCYVSEKQAQTCLCVYFRNLQAAVGAFYDHYSQEGGALPDIALVTRVVEDVGALDLRVPVPGGSVVTETWTLRNTGENVGDRVGVV